MFSSASSDEALGLVCTHCRLLRTYHHPVADKKGGNKPWKNLFSYYATAFPPAVTPEDSDSIVLDNFQLTSFDQASGVRCAAAGTTRERQ